MSTPEFRFEEARSAAERMDELGRFLEYWFGKRRPEYGEPEDRPDRLPLPYPLRRFYALAGQWPSAGPETLELFYTGSGGHHLRDLDSVEQQADGKLDFFMEYQGDWSGLTLPDAEDPPVWLSGWVGECDEERTVRVCDSLSRFLVTHCLMTILYEYENAPCAISAREGPLVDRFHDGSGKAVRIWDTAGLDWPISCLMYRGEFFLIPFSGGILVHRDGKDYRFGALRPGGISIMLGALLSGPHR
jgi:hypothetical protein